MKLRCGGRKAGRAARDAGTQGPHAKTHSNLNQRSGLFFDFALSRDTAVRLVPVLTLPLMVLSIISSEAFDHFPPPPLKISDTPSPSPPATPFRPKSAIAPLPDIGDPLAKWLDDSSNTGDYYQASC